MSLTSMPFCLESDKIKQPNRTLHCFSRDQSVLYKNNEVLKPCFTCHFFYCNSGNTAYFNQKHGWIIFFLWNVRKVAFSLKLKILNRLFLKLLLQLIFSQPCCNYDWIPSCSLNSTFCWHYHSSKYTRDFLCAVATYFFFFFSLTDFCTSCDKKSNLNS